MPAVRNVRQTGRRAPNLTKEQRAAARRRYEELWGEVIAARESYSATITRLSQRYGRSRTWVAMQLYSAGSLVKKKRRVNRYNAMLHDRSRRRKELGLPSEGRQTLTNLARDTSADDWDSMSPEERERVLSQLTHEREQRVIAKRIPTKNAAIDVNRVCAGVNPELQALHNRTGAEFILLVLHGDAADNWHTQAWASAKAANACHQIFKANVEELAARIDGFIVAGIEGVRKEVGGRRYNSLKGKVRTMIMDRFRDICIRKGFARDELPKDMKWAGYENLVTRYGVKLEGWTEEGGVCNPGDFKSCPPLERLLAALEGPSPLLRWVELSEEEWQERKEALITAPAGTRKKSALGEQTTRKKRGRRPQSAEEVETSDDESRCNSPEPSSSNIAHSPQSASNAVESLNAGAAPAEAPEPMEQEVRPVDLQPVSPSPSEQGGHDGSIVADMHSADTSNIGLLAHVALAVPTAPGGSGPPTDSAFVFPHEIPGPHVSLPDVPLLDSHNCALSSMAVPGSSHHQLFAIPSISGAFSASQNPYLHAPFAPPPDISLYSPLESDWAAGMDDATLAAIASGRY